jgi:hypothetical protein
MTGSTFSSLIIFLSSLEPVKNIGKRLVKGQKMSTEWCIFYKGWLDPHLVTEFLSKGWLTCSHTYVKLDLDVKVG